MEYLPKKFSEYCKPYLSLRGQKNVLEISNIIEELLDIKIFKKQNKLKNKILLGYYEKFLKLQEGLGRSEGVKGVIGKRYLFFQKNSIRI